MWTIRILLSALAFTLLSGLSYADNITVWDHNGSCASGSCEDDETEPGTIATQTWDLEAFLLTGNSLSIVGGFKFDTGVNFNGKLYTSGHLFIDVTGNAKYGKNWANAAPLFNGYNNAGWDYAVVFDFVNSSYDVYQIDARTRVYGTTDILNSHPWRIRTLGLTAILAQKSFAFNANASDSGFSNWGAAANPIPRHKIDGIDLGFLGQAKGFTAHFTMECGNDNLIGVGTTSVPEPVTVLLVGLGVAGLAALRKFKA